ncbi:MAG TPA: hypothetical protein VHA73_02795 [Acidimicrobiales bacterium]|jgi:hypothetical protein|nr:hypothetical protein [Acidimicrobiales bacterium]
MAITIVCAFALAVVAAIRGTWSPCGLSMLSTITPVTERARGHRYPAAAAWFIAGAAVGGACLGAVAAAIAAAFHAVGPSRSLSLALVGAAALVGVASDLAVFGISLPLHPRQVDETWLRKFRTWVYAGGFGWQIGTGFATYIMTAATYALVVVAALTASPVVAFAACVTFGTLRGAAVLLSARARTPERLAALHRRLDRAEPASRALAVAGQAAVAAGAVAALAGPGWSTAVIAACLAATLRKVRSGLFLTRPNA